MLLRAFGAGFGVGTAWASADGTNRPTISAAASEAERSRIESNRDRAPCFCFTTCFSCKPASALSSEAQRNASPENALVPPLQFRLGLGSRPAVRSFRCPVNDSSCAADATRFTGFSAQIGTGFGRHRAPISICERRFRWLEPAPVPSSRPSAGATLGLWRFRDPLPELCIGPITLSKTAFFLFDEDLAFTGVVGLPDDAFLLHALHQRRGAVIPDLQPALNVAG